MKKLKYRSPPGLVGEIFKEMGVNAVAMPGVITLALPPQLSSQRLARRMERSGYQLASRSDYLVRRNWLQICLMGEWAPAALDVLPDVLAWQVKHSPAPVPGEAISTAPASSATL